MPHAFFDGLMKRARKAPGSICLPESSSPDILRLADAIVRAGIGRPWLIGRPEELMSRCGDLGIDGRPFHVFDNRDEPSVERLADAYMAQCDQFARKPLLRRIADPLLCSMVLVRAGMVDCVAAGKECPTGDVVAAAMGVVGLAEGMRTPSSLGIADIPGYEGPQGSMLALADCALTVQPDAEELAGIAIASGETVRAMLGWEPRIAMLSFSTCGSAEHASLNVVREAVSLVRERRPDLACDGEFQLDAALVPHVAEYKVGRASDVAGRANTLIFPNLHAGNIGVKMVQIFGHANAYGPVLQGFAKPVCDFSRSAPLEEMLGNVAMLVMRARATVGEAA